MKIKEYEKKQKANGITVNENAVQAAKDDEKVATDDAGSATSTTGKTAAKTGDSANAAVPAAVGLAAVLAVLAAWKKKAN